MTRILDLDLDIFVTPINTIHSDVRLSDDDYDVLPVDEVNRFLAEKCGLAKGSPKRGQVIEEHDELFDVLKGLVDGNAITTPFELVHVDAHADMGAGQWKPYKYLLTDLMHRDVGDRGDPIRGSDGLNRGTIVLFLAACGWLNKIHYVHHTDDGKDFCELFLDYDVSTEELFFQIPRCTKEQFSQWDPPFNSVLDLQNEWELGPRIPFELTPFGEFQQPGFDFVFLTRSPGFTPAKADIVFKQISEYIQPC